MDKKHTITKREIHDNISYAQFMRDTGLHILNYDERRVIEWARQTMLNLLNGKDGH